jgi:flagellar motility protein MotE (MotC chaperone)
MELQEEKESGILKKLQWFIFVIFIPMLFATVVGLVVLTFAGINVVDAAKKYGSNIPGISKLVAEEDKAINLEEKLRKDIVDLEATNKDQLTTIADLEKEVEKSQAEVETLQSKIDQLTEQLNMGEDQVEHSKQTMKDIAGIYESMSAKNAAAIITELQDQDAIQILQSLSSDALGEILEKMEPTEAAKYTRLLSALTTQ